MARLLIKPSGIREQHDLQHDPWVVGRGSGLIVLESGIER